MTLIERGFIQSVAEADEADRAGGSEAILHSTKLALVDRGNRVVGLFDVKDEAGMAALRERAAPARGPGLGAGPAGGQRLAERRAAPCSCWSAGS